MALPYVQDGVFRVYVKGTAVRALKGGHSPPAPRCVPAAALRSWEKSALVLVLMGLV